MNSSVQRQSIKVKVKFRTNVNNSIYVAMVAFLGDTFLHLTLNQHPKVHRKYIRAHSGESSNNNNEMQTEQIQTEFRDGNLNVIDKSYDSRLPKMIYQWMPHGRRRRQQSWKNQMTDFMRNKIVEEIMAEDKHFINFRFKFFS